MCQESWGATVLVVLMCLMDPRYINQVRGEIGHYYRPEKKEREMKNQGKGNGP